MDATVLLLLGEGDAATLCGLLGVEPGRRAGRSALGEIGNILGASYVGALGAMTGLELEPEPPQSAHDMLGADRRDASSPPRSGADDVALVLDSDLDRRGRRLLALLPAAADARRRRGAAARLGPGRLTAMAETDGRAWASSRVSRRRRRRARLARPGLVHRPRAGRPAGGASRASPTSCCPPPSGRDGDARASSPTRAVPALLDAVVALGARRARLEAVLVGGAQMFAFGRHRPRRRPAQRGRGARGAAARWHPDRGRRRPAARKGRTVRVHVGDGRA